MRLFNSAREYHEKTKYTFDDVKTAYHEIDSRSKPESRKSFPGKPRIDLPQAAGDTTETLQAAYRTSRQFGRFRMISDSPVSFEDVALLLHMCNGVTRARDFRTGKIFLRAAPTASGLYPVETYFFANHVKGLEQGIYYFSPEENCLIRIAERDIQKNIFEAGFQLQFLENAPLTIFFNSVFSRSSWKFRDRAYRYCLMDAGYIGENLVLGAASVGLSANLLGDFNDDEINRLLQIDGTDEAVVMMAVIGQDAGEYREGHYSFGMLTPGEDHIGENETNLTQKIHQKSGHSNSATNLTTVNVSFPFDRVPSKKVPGENLVDLPEPEKLLGKSVLKTISQRRSSYNFLRVSISLQELSIVLFNLRFVPVLYDYPAFFIYVVINDAQDTQNGIYLYHPDAHKLELLRAGTFRGDLSYLTLAQDAIFNCSAAIFFSTYFEDIDIFANRGYRYALFDTGMLGENIYLTSTSLGLAVRGIGNFFDDSINTFFKVREPHEKILGGVIIGHS